MRRGTSVDGREKEMKIFNPACLSKNEGRALRSLLNQREVLLMSLPTIPLAFKTLVVDKNEPMTIPEEFREPLGLKEGGVYTVVQFDSFLFLSPKPLVSLEALERMRKVFEGEGITLDDLLGGLEEVRQEIYEERFGSGNENPQSVP